MREKPSFFENHDQIPQGTNVIDRFDNQLKELAEVNNPSLIAESFEGIGVEVYRNDAAFLWTYFPWKNAAIKILKKEDFRKVRLSRNLNLITKVEQEKLLSSRIAIAGLNVGHPGAICLALEGVSERMKLADFDELSLSNLNRFRAGVLELGQNKAVLTARQIYEIDPFYEVEIFDKGLSDTNIDDFLSGIDLLIEEMDNMPLKIKIREKAREKGIPVLMVTGNDSGLIIDVERYDLDINLPILNGRLPEEVQKRVFELKPGQSKFSELVELLKDFMEGDKTLHKKLLDSFPEVGKTIAGIPQLSEASFLRGAMLCYFARRILTNQAKTGRYIFHPESLV